MRVLAPLPGVVVALKDAPDPVFATNMLGDGVGLLPGSGPAQSGLLPSQLSGQIPSQIPGQLTVLAPISGIVNALMPHAFVVGPILVHLGIDSAGSDTFTIHCEKGEEVRAGQPVITWDLNSYSQLGLSPFTCVVALGGLRVRPLLSPGAQAEAGTALFEATVRDS